MLKRRMRPTTAGTDASVLAVDRAIANTSTADIPRVLETLTLEAWGELLLDIPADCPNLRARFPSMPPDEAQDQWTGTHGTVLLAQGVQFTRWLVTQYEQVTGSAIRDATVLDFGCGWGRLLRLLYKYVDVDHLFGVDPMERSIQICRDHGVLGHLAVSDYVPNTLPFAGPFDLIFAFSVFTHLSEKTMRVALATLREHIADGGLLAITIRPADYWRVSGRDAMIAEHDRGGFAFVPHNLAPIDGDITYGDTSMTIDWLARAFPSWRVVGEQTGPRDQLQTYVLLAPA